MSKFYQLSCKVSGITLKASLKSRNYHDYLQGCVRYKSGDTWVAELPHPVWFHGESGLDIYGGVCVAIRSIPQVSTSEEVQST
jgi:hypothetical protein